MTEALKMFAFTLSVVTGSDFHCHLHILIPPVEFFDPPPRKHLNIY